jgi:hypothetical protein
MEEQGQPFDEAVYKELNLYFRSRIRELLEEHPELLRLKQENKLQLSDLVVCMPVEDQNRWQRFMQLDQLKLNQDIINHLEGKGEPYNPHHRMGNPFADLTENPETW